MHKSPSIEEIDKTMMHIKELMKDYAKFKGIELPDPLSLEVSFSMNENGMYTLEAKPI